MPATCAITSSLFFGTKDLGWITPEDIEHYIAAKRKTLAMKTIGNRLVTIHSAFEIGLRRGWCHQNPVKRADRPVTRTSETRIRYLEQRELEALLEVEYPSDAFGAIEPTLYLTAAMTNLRQGELLEDSVGATWTSELERFESCRRTSEGSS